MNRAAPVATRRGRDGEEGFALLMVLLFLMAVTAIVAPLVLGARTDFVVASNRLQQDRLEALAEGLLTVIARNLAAPPLEARNEGITVRSEPLRCLSGRYRIEARVQDQRGLIGINNAQPELLAAGFEALGFERGDIDDLVEALVAYRTPPPGEEDPPPGDPPPEDPPTGEPPPDADPGQPPQRANPRLRSMVDSERVNGGLKLKPLEAIEELYDFTGFRGRPVREIAEVFSVQNTVDTVVGARLSTRLARVLPAGGSPGYPFIVTQPEDGPKTYRIEVEVGTADGGIRGYAGATVLASEGEAGDFQFGERTTNPEFLPEAQGDFSGAMDCSMIFGVGVVAELAAGS